MTATAVGGMHSTGMHSYIFTDICDSVHRGVCLSACWDAPWQGDPPGKEPPWQGDPPHEHCMLGDTVYKRAVCILLECNLVLQIFLFC